MERGRGMLQAAALAGVATLLVACGTTDSASEDRLPPMRTTIPTTTTVPPTLPQEDIYYTVQQGDALGRIAEEFQVPIQAIVDANGLSSPDAIQAGQTLLIPSGVRVVTDLPGGGQASSDSVADDEP